MKASARLQVQMLIQNGIFAVLLVAAAFLIVWLLRGNKMQWDLTQSQRNTDRAGACYQVSRLF